MTDGIRLDPASVSLYYAFAMDRATEQIREALDRAEAEIRDLGAEAFRSGDDNGAGQAREIVLTFKSLRSQLNGRTSHAARASVKGRRRSTRRSKSATHRTRKQGTSKYPRFCVRNESLIRTGWSKKQKSEYEHKASRTTFDRTVAAMAHIATTGPGPFTSEQIIERVNDSENTFPGYQVYVVIGLLREHGCIEQVGRDGYMIPEDVSSRASDVWNTIGEENK